MALQLGPAPFAARGYLRLLAGADILQPAGDGRARDDPFKLSSQILLHREARGSGSRRQLVAYVFGNAPDGDLHSHASNLRSWKAKRKHCTERSAAAVIPAK